MDSSLHSAQLTVDGRVSSQAAHHEEAVVGAEEEHHIHLPNASWWPLMLSAAILVAVTGLLFIPDNPWLLVAAAPFVLIGILGWALEDPMASPEAQSLSTQPGDVKQRLGQGVLDKDGNWLGLVQARFSDYVLVDSGDFFTRAYYVPYHFFAEGTFKDGLLLNVNEAELLRRGLNSVPGDLHKDTPEAGLLEVKGTPLFARGPLSPAETGHYNFGPNFPGINTDASGSYRPDEVRPSPQKYVSDRRSLYPTRETVSSRVASSR